MPATGHVSGIGLMRNKIGIMQNKYQEFMANHFCLKRTNKKDSVNLMLYI